jgi:hypothetical protein
MRCAGVCDLAVARLPAVDHSLSSVATRPGEELLHRSTSLTIA